MRRFFYTALSVFLIALAFFGINDNNKKWRKQMLLSYDAAIYYSYLPAVFIYRDLDLRYVDTLPPRLREYKKTHYEELPNGKRYIKTTMGLAYLHLPFFALAHWKAGVEGKQQDGYARTYENFLAYGAYFYVILAFILLARVLRAYFSDEASALALLSIGLGSNLMYYATLEALHVHAYNFSLFCFLLYGVYRYFQLPKAWKAFLLGLLLGLIALIRPTNILIGLLIPLYGVTAFAGFKERLLFLLKNWPSVLIFSAAFFIPWIPQMFYWHQVSGQWLFFSYGGAEGFFWTDPKFLYGFFSYRKGLFLYTPMMGLAFLGIFALRKYAPGFLWPLLAFIPLNYYAMFSWWSWWYGGCYGMRPAIDSYGLMAVPLAAFFAWAFSRSKAAKIALLSVWSLLMALSVFQTWQYKNGLIHYDSMTREAYWAVFLKTEKPENYDALLQMPINERAQQGVDEYREGREKRKPDN